VNAPGPGIVRRAGTPPPSAAAVSGEVLPAAFVEIGGRTIAIPPGGALIGRATDADIVIAANEVSAITPRSPRTARAGR